MGAITGAGAMPPRRPDLTCAQAVRERKDPARWHGNMDAAREYLQSADGGPGGPLSGLLNVLGEGAFGANTPQRRPAGALGLLGALYRTLLRWGPRPEAGARCGHVQQMQR